MPPTPPTPARAGSRGPAAGRHIPPAQAKRGDLIFYGPGGSQHVTLYLGDGQMLEAPDIGLKVRVAPVRSGGMTPYVIRYIEY